MNEQSEYYQDAKQYANETRRARREQGINELMALPIDKYTVEELQQSQFLVNSKYVVYPIKGTIVIKRTCKSVRYERGKLLKALEEIETPVKDWKLVWMVSNTVKETIRPKGNYADLAQHKTKIAHKYQYGQLKIVPAT